MVRVPDDHQAAVARQARSEPALVSTGGMVWIMDRGREPVAQLLAELVFLGRVAEVHAGNDNLTPFQKLAWRLAYSMMSGTL